MKLYRHFLDGLPRYLVRHYWWAYLWRPAAWFFDHQFIINLILFGQYKKLMNATLGRLNSQPSGQVLQLTCVYGSLTRNLFKQLTAARIHIADVSDVQLENARRKHSSYGQLDLARMNAEQLAYKDDAFSVIVMFFLLHEMPPESRRNTLAECMRVLSTGGVLVYSEYAPLPTRHALFRFPVARFLFTKLEPFLAGYWKEDIARLLEDLGRPYGKGVEIVCHETFFSGFYRVTEFKVVDIAICADS